MDWWLPFAAGAAVCLTLVCLVPIARGLGARAIGWGAALVPVTALWLWALGFTAPLYTLPPGQHWQVTVGTHGVSGISSWQFTVLTHGIFGISSQMARFWLGLAVVAASGAHAAFAPRRAGYLAAAGLVVFALYETFVGWAIVPRAFGPAWYDWFFIGLTRLAGWPVVLAAAAAGVSLTRRTIVADLKARGTLTARVKVLTETRAEAVDAAAAELRRLERDLHDGAQARLVALGINLRTAERMIRTNPDAAAALVAECRETSAQALSDLRNLVRGIYPPVLADRGLGDAVRAFALDCPVRVVTLIDLPGRPPPPVESAVYFAVGEALNNVAKHADATSALVRMQYEGGVLRAEITDDGNGGADARNGTGLAGIERRLGTFDGIVAVSSPAGGPTIVVVEVPCELSSPKISIS